MAWSLPRTWSVSEFVTASLLNTHIRDNLLFLKSNPVIAEGVTTATVNSNTNAVVLGSIAIPADVGAVYCEAWATSVGFFNAPGSGNSFNWYIQIASNEAGEHHLYTGSQYASTTSDTSSAYPYYARTRDLAWAGLTRNVFLGVTASNCSAFISGTAASPIVLRIVRAY